MIVKCSESTSDSRSSRALYKTQRNASACSAGSSENNVDESQRKPLRSADTSQTSIFSLSLLTTFYDHAILKL